MKKKIYSTPSVTTDYIKNVDMICVSTGFEDGETEQMHSKYRGFDHDPLEEAEPSSSPFQF